MAVLCTTLKAIFWNRFSRREINAGTSAIPRAKRELLLLPSIAKLPDWFGMPLPGRTWETAMTATFIGLLWVCRRNLLVEEEYGLRWMRWDGSPVRLLSPVSQLQLCPSTRSHPRLVPVAHTYPRWSPVNVWFCQQCTDWSISWLCLQCLKKGFGRDFCIRVCWICCIQKLYVVAQRSFSGTPNTPDFRRVSVASAVPVSALLWTAQLSKLRFWLFTSSLTEFCSRVFQQKWRFCLCDWTHLLIDSRHKLEFFERCSGLCSSGLCEFSQLVLLV